MSIAVWGSSKAMVQSMRQSQRLDPAHVKNYGLVDVPFDTSAQIRQTVSSQIWQNDLKIWIFTS